MASWFAALMQRGDARSGRALPGAKHTPARDLLAARDPRYDAIVRMLRDREADDRAAREKRQRGYRQSLESEPDDGDVGATESSPIRLHRIRAKVPCRMTADARALLEEIRQRSTGSRIAFSQLANGKQAVMLLSAHGAAPREIGWVEQRAQTDPARCNVRDQGLSVETDGSGMLVLRFLYPSTPVKVSSAERPRGAPGEAPAVEFAELRPALDLRAVERSSSPRLVWITRHEAEAMNALQSREYEAFYVRFKLEVQAGIWNSLSTVLASSPGSRWHRGSCYTVVRERDAANRRIHQRTIDDSGRAVDIGADRVYDAAPATDILLLYLDGDILADIADIYFTLQSLDSTDGWFLKEELFTVVRRFWTSAGSLTSRAGSDLAAVMRMSQRVLPMPAQAPLLKQDWTSLRQSLVDRYGARGRKAPELASRAASAPHVRPNAWPFESFPAGEVNVGLRLVYRQEWRDLGAQRGEVIRTVPPMPPRLGPEPAAITSEGVLPGRTADSRIVETIVEPDDSIELEDLVARATQAMIEAMKWRTDREGSIDTGVRALGGATDVGLEPGCRESSRDTSTRLTDIMRKMVERIHAERPVVESVDSVDEGESEESPPACEEEAPADQDALTRVYSRLQSRYEVITRPAEIENVVLVAEKLPAPAEIDLAWVRRHDWILAKVLLDESFRDALSTIGQEARTPRRGVELDAKRDPLYEHIRANILHYQRAIWQREDPQQRSMRYRKSGKKVPLEWRFEIEAGEALTIDELCERLAAPDVDGQFASYSSGRSAELDQLIDPAGPIGYYANYAVYRMRPELGATDLFSMLHFFKSPWLRPHPETGQPEVEDPVQIQISQDPAVTGASDQAIAAHRGEMIHYVPELRHELAAAHETSADGSGARAVNALERETQALRRHYAAYVYHRERSRQVALDTNGVVIDVVRSAPEELEERTGAEAAGRDEGSADASVMTAECELMFDSAQAIELRGANGHRPAERGAALIRCDVELARTLFAGASGEAALPDDPLRMPLIVARADDRGQLPILVVSRALDVEVEPVIRARDDPGRGLSAGVIAGASEPELRAILSRRDDERTPKLLVGLAARDAEPSLIIGRGDCEVRLAPRAEIDTSQDRGVVLPSRGEEERSPALLAGAGEPNAGEKLILARDDRRLRLIPGAAAGHARTPVIVAEENEWLRPSLVAG